MLLLIWPERTPSNTTIRAWVDRVRDWRMIGFWNGWQTDGSITMDYSFVIQAVSHTARHILLEVSRAIKIGCPLGGDWRLRALFPRPGWSVARAGLGKPKRVNIY